MSVLCLDELAEQQSAPKTSTPFPNSFGKPSASVDHVFATRLELQAEIGQIRTCFETLLQERLAEVRRELSTEIENVSAKLDAANKTDADLTSTIPRTNLEDVSRSVGSKRANIRVPHVELNIGDQHALAIRSSANNDITLSMQLAEDYDWYTWNSSMWDAGLLLFFHGTRLYDKVILVCGCLLNVGLQWLLFFVIVYDMLEDNYNDSTVSDMMKWRVHHGHNNAEFDFVRGESMAAKLCRGQLWSFEGDQYRTMVAYLYKPMPGIVLSVLATILWVLSTMTEFRRCTEQWIAIWKLPILEQGQYGIRRVLGGEIEIVGITNRSWYLAIVFLSVPRFSVCIALTFVGCRYLAQTISLSSILLNAGALCFFLDVDEQLADVLLSEKLRYIVRKLRPMSCGMQKRTLGGASWIDFLRITLTLNAILFTVFFWLVPFSANVSDAAMAICGGQLDFTYTGGTAASPDLTLMPAEHGDQTACDYTTNRTYQRRYYPNYTFDTASILPVKNYTPVKETQEEELRANVLKYAFASEDCPFGQVRTPPQDTEISSVGFFESLFGGLVAKHRDSNSASPFMEGACAVLPYALTRALPHEVATVKYTFEDCPRLDISKREHACIEPSHPGVCIWSHQAQKCEGMGFPGVIFQSGCKSDLWLACNTWEKMFNTSHPSRNCLITHYCSQDFPRCLVMQGWLELTVTASITLPDNLTSLADTVALAFAQSFNVVDPWSSASFQAFFFRGSNLIEFDCSAYSHGGSCPRGYPSYCYWTGSDCRQTTTTTSVLWMVDEVYHGQRRCDGPPKHSWGNFGSRMTADQCRLACLAKPECRHAVLLLSSGMCTEFEECSVLKYISNKPFKIFQRKQCSSYNNRTDCPDACIWRNSTVSCDQPQAIGPGANPGAASFVPTKGLCRDLDHGALDMLGNRCSGYALNLGMCGTLDDADFTSSVMCCACGGGDTFAADGVRCRNRTSHCVMVFFALTAVHEDLSTELVVAAKGNVTASMNAYLSSNPSHLNSNRTVLGSYFLRESISFSRV